MILWYCDILWYLVPRLDWWTPWKILWLYQRTIYYSLIFRESDLHMWAGRVSSLSGQNPTQRARKQKKQLFLLTYYLVIFAPWLKKRPHVSRSNCLLSWTHDPEIKNSSCKTQKSGERHRTIIFKGKHLFETKLGDRMRLLWPFDWNWGMNIFHGLPSGRLSR